MSLRRLVCTFYKPKLKRIFCCILQPTITTFNKKENFKTQTTRKLTDLVEMKMIYLSKCLNRDIYMEIIMDCAKNEKKWGGRSIIDGEYEERREEGRGGGGEEEGGEA